MCILEIMVTVEMGRHLAYSDTTIDTTYNWNVGLKDRCSYTYMTS